jgi:hypothetical protein
MSEKSKITISLIGCFTLGFGSAMGYAFGMATIHGIGDLCNYCYKKSSIYVANHPALKRLFNKEESSRNREISDGDDTSLSALD